jgi:hypothetical protein
VASWRCTGCRTVYAVGIPACPHCSSRDYEEDGVAKANAEGAATHYVGEGDPVPDDLPPGVRMVGPGAPAEPEAEVQGEPEPEVTPEPEPVPEAVSGPQEPEVVPDPPEEHATIPGPDSTPEPSSPESSAPDDDDDDDGLPDYMAYRIVDLRELCRNRDLSPTGPKAELAERLAEHDAERAP